MHRAHAAEAGTPERPHLAKLLFSDPEQVESVYQTKGQDQRRSTRQRVLLSALVVHPDFAITFKCGIRDVSEEGAKLKAPPGLLIPSDFMLIDIGAGKAYEARTAWRRYPYVGVSIRGPIDLVEPQGRMARKLRALWLGVIS
jgi:hypothetical protein